MFLCLLLTLFACWKRSWMGPVFCMSTECWPVTMKMCVRTCLFWARPFLGECFQYVCLSVLLVVCLSCCLMIMECFQYISLSVRLSCLPVLPSDDSLCHWFCVCVCVFNQIGLIYQITEQNVRILLFFTVCCRFFCDLLLESRDLLSYFAHCQKISYCDDWQCRYQQCWLMMSCWLWEHEMCVVCDDAGVSSTGWWWGHADCESLKCVLCVMIDSAGVSSTGWWWGHADCESLKCVMMQVSAVLADDEVMLTVRAWSVCCV